MTEHVACQEADLEAGKALRVELKFESGLPHLVAVIRAKDGAFYAIDDTCTHGEVSLSEGDVLECEIECWAHGGRFDFRTGTATELPAIESVHAYPVRIDDGHVFVDIDSPLSPQKENA